MIRYMLDTDIMSYLMKKNNPSHQKIVSKLVNEEEGSVAISVITLSEISRGIEKIKDKQRQLILMDALNDIFTSIIVLEFNDEAAWIYGKIRDKLCDIGQDIGIMDSLIAAHALSQKLTLVTNNSDHFYRVSEFTDLRIENWTDVRDPTI